MHMRSDVPVGAFLSSGIDSTAVVALARRVQPEHPHLHRRLRRAGLLRDRRRPGLGPAPRRDHDPDQDRAAGHDRRAAARSSGTSTTRWPTRRWCRSTSWPRRPPSTSPWCSPARAPTSSSAATRSTASRCRWPASTACPTPVQKGLRAVSKAIPQGVKGKSFLERGTTPIEERYYGNARMFTEEEKQHLLRRYDPSVRYTDVTAPIYAECTRARRRHQDAVRRPLHLAARRHPGQGRPDVDGALAGGAGAVPGPGGLRRRGRPSRST